MPDACLAGAELCSLSPRQALSLLFDTFHNEVDAFLAAEVSTRDGEGHFWGHLASFAADSFPFSLWGSKGASGKGKGHEGRGN